MGGWQWFLRTTSLWNKRTASSDDDFFVFVYDFYSKHYNYKFYEYHYVYNIYFNYVVHDYHDASISRPRWNLLLQGGLMRIVEIPITVSQKWRDYSQSDPIGDIWGYVPEDGVPDELHFQWDVWRMIRCHPDITRFAPGTRNAGQYPTQEEVADLFGCLKVCIQRKRGYQVNIVLSEIET